MPRSYTILACAQEASCGVSCGATRLLQFALTIAAGAVIFADVVVAQFIEKPLLALLIVVLLFNLSQRRHIEHGERKRTASLAFAGFALLLYAATMTIIRFGLPDYLLAVPVLVATLLALRFKNTLFLFKLHCVQCGSPLPIKTTLYYDDNLCPDCRGEEEYVDTDASQSREVNAVNWDDWTPDQIAALCLIIHGDKLLLIRKKTGLGAGKINMPGGRIEPGETALEAVVRECREEVGITPHTPEKRVDLSFEFADGLSLHCSAFFAYAYSGELEETDEADPFWCDIDKIPYDEMWADDALWIPRAIRGERLEGKFLFDGDTMVSQDIRSVDTFD